MEDPSSKKALIRVGGDSSVVRYSNALIRRGLGEIVLKASQRAQSQRRKPTPLDILMIGGPDMAFGGPCLEAVHDCGFIGFMIEARDGVENMIESLKSDLYCGLVVTNDDKDTDIPELVSAARRQFPHLGIIVLSTDTDPQQITMSKKAGADDFVSVPNGLSVPSELEDLKRSLARVAFWRMTCLRGLLREHDYHYYVLKAPTVTDAHYDELRRELHEFEARYPGGP